MEEGIAVLDLLLDVRVKEAVPQSDGIRDVARSRANDSLGGQDEGDDGSVGAGIVSSFQPLLLGDGGEDGDRESYLPEFTDQSSVSTCKSKVVVLDLDFESKSLNPRPNSLSEECSIGLSPCPPNHFKALNQPASLVSSTDPRED